MFQDVQGIEWKKGELNDSFMMGEDKETETQVISDSCTSFWKHSLIPALLSYLK